MISSLAESEKDIGQTESVFEKRKRCGERKFLSIGVKFLWKEGP